MVKISSATQTARNARANADRTMTSSKQPAAPALRFPQPNRSSREPTESTTQHAAAASSVSGLGRSKVATGIVTPSAVSLAASSGQVLPPTRRPKVLLEEDEYRSNEGAAGGTAADNEETGGTAADNEEAGGTAADDGEYRPANENPMSIFDQLPDVEESSRNSAPG